MKKQYNLDESLWGLPIYLAEIFLLAIVMNTITLPRRIYHAFRWRQHRS